MGIFKVNFPKIDFHQEVFDNLIGERGMTVAWQKAALCPCVRADQAGRTIFACGMCNNGNLYLPPTSITAVITNIAGQRNAAIYGEIASGGIFVTTYGANRLGINDRIVLTTSTTRYAEMGRFPSAKVKTTAAGSTTLTLDHTRKFPQDGTTVMYARIGTTQVISYTGTTPTTLTGIPVSGPYSLTGSEGVGTAVTAMSYQLRFNPLVLEDARTDSAVLVEGTDFTRTSHFLQFTSPTALPTGSFTVLYEAYPVYIIDSLSHEYRDQMARLGYTAPQLSRLPVAAVARKDVWNTAGGS